MKKYSEKLKNQILEEVELVQNIALVAKKYQMPTSTIKNWLRKLRQLPAKNQSRPNAQVLIKENKQLKKQLSEKDEQILVLQELLKKTYAVWSNDSK